MHGDLFGLVGGVCCFFLLREGGGTHSIHGRSRPVLLLQPKRWVRFTHVTCLESGSVVSLSSPFGTPVPFLTIN